MEKDKKTLALEKQVEEIGKELQRLQAENERLKELLNMNENDESY
jgi:cell shape-determining protein MreC